MLLECTFGELRFSGKILTDYTRTFEVILASTSIQECVQDCYELGCVRAAFTHFPRSACLLNFEAKEPELAQRCIETSTNQLDIKWDFSTIPEVVELECVRCVKENGDSGKKLDNTILMHIFFYTFFYFF